MGIRENFTFIKRTILLFAGIILTTIVAGFLHSCRPDSAESEKELPEKVSYNFHIKPILSDRCFACHGPDPGHR